MPSPNVQVLSCYQLVARVSSMADGMAQHATTDEGGAAAGKGTTDSQPKHQHPGGAHVTRPLSRPEEALVVLMLSQAREAAAAQELVVRAANAFASAAAAAQHQTYMHMEQWKVRVRCTGRSAVCVPCSSRPSHPPPLLHVRPWH